MDLVREYSVSAVGRFRYSASSKHYMYEQVSKMKFKFKFIEELISKKRILIAIGADQTAGIFRKALTAFECVLPEDRDEHIELLDRISTDRVEKILSECDNEFFKYPDDLAELNHKFILINMEEFT